MSNELLFRQYGPCQVSVGLGAAREGSPRHRFGGMAGATKSHYHAFVGGMSGRPLPRIRLGSRAFAMKVFLAFALVLAGVLPVRAECLSSARAVWTAHPGSHATWRLRLPGHEGVKCWFAAGKRKPMDADASAEADSEASAVGAISVPALRPLSTQAGAEGGSLQAPPQAPRTGDAKSILIWGQPMEIDATWDEMFTRRELRTK